MRWFVVVVLAFVLVSDIWFARSITQYEIGSTTKHQTKEDTQYRPIEGPFVLSASKFGAWLVDIADEHDKAITALSTVAIAVFTVILAWATTGLWKMADIQSGDMKESLRIADESSRAALKSAQVAEDTLKISQRAWLSVQNIFIEPSITTLGTPLNVIVHFKNTGNSPALKIRGVSVSEFMGPTGSPSFNYEREKVITLGSMAPNADHNAPNHMDIDMASGMPKPFTQERVNALTLKLVRYCAHGRVDYEDIFGEPHWFTYCYFLAVPITGQFLIHSEHNDTDDADRQRRQ